MTADEDIRHLRCQKFFYSWIVPWRSAPDVGHPDIDALAFEPQVFREPGLKVLVVDVAIDAPQWFEIFQRFCYCDVTKITAMPDLVAIPEVFKNFGIQESMRV